MYTSFFLFAHMAKEIRDSEFTTKNRRTLKPLVIIVLIAAVFLPLSIIAIDYVREIRTEALPTEKPQDIEVSNIGDTSATISWVTPGTETIGFIKYGPEGDLKFVGYDIRDEGSAEGKYTLHYVEIGDLVPGANYKYNIVVGGKEYDNDGKSYSFKTGPILETVQTPRPLKGEVEDSTGDSEEVIVYLYVKKNATISNKISTLTNEKRYTLDLSNLRTSDLSSYFSDLEGSSLYFTAQGADRGEGTLVTEIYGE